MNESRKRGRVVFAVLASMMLMTSCDMPKKGQDSQKIEKSEDVQNKLEDTDSGKTSSEKKKQIIQASGKTLEERFEVPIDYTRDTYKKDSFGAFVREYPMKKDGHKVRLYNGRKKLRQSSAAAVFSMEVGDRDLQQCADSVIRMYAEYFYQSKQYDRMKFHFVDGFECNFEKWAEGYRVNFQNDKTSWEKTSNGDDSYESFQKYLNIVFSYASTLSLEQECEPIDWKDVQIGDVFIKAGSPGHVVMVVDVCTNGEGKKAVLLAQGYMPAQEFHVITNPEHKKDPWYYEDEITSPFVTAEYTFPDGTCKRPNY